MMKGKKSSCQTGEKPLTELDQIKPVTSLGKFSQYTVQLPHSQGQTVTDQPVLPRPYGGYRGCMRRGDWHPSQK